MINAPEWIACLRGSQYTAESSLSRRPGLRHEDLSQFAIAE